jgi:hypothetical protein
MICQVSNELEIFIFDLMRNVDIPLNQMNIRLRDIHINNQFDTCTNKFKILCKATDRARLNDEQVTTNQSHQLPVFRA